MGVSLDLSPILALVKAGYAVFAFDQTGFGRRIFEAQQFYERFPRCSSSAGWSRTRARRWTRWNT